MRTAVGVILIVISILLLKTNLEERKIAREGEIVKMTIVDLPESCASIKGNYFVTFQYQQFLFKKRIPAGFCKKHKVGEVMDVRYSDQHYTVLWPGEDVNKGLWFPVLAGVTGLGIITYALFRKSTSIGSGSKQGKNSRK
ncbi:hypothetical protein HNQ91_001312 [Filimonas zeae]|uniref:DUF3592 domain-containing protein n=1 Tax=Filimonas zeae TaxID=1737353 RepID=A0A917ITB1_9BACT|nr:hypothetical protein [Filimonas zeae]MDR6338290.1 hypothetical protein [Filimonas zeae]GGH62666.1 hypothetical protein GCM10011379_12850 [Filimonas zeae]